MKPKVLVAVACVLLAVWFVAKEMKSGAEPPTPILCDGAGDESRVDNRNPRGVRSDAPKPSSSSNPNPQISVDEVRLGKWSNYPRGVPSDVLSMRISGGALDSSGNLTPAAVRLFTLSNDEEISVNRVLADCFQRAAKSSAERVEAVPGRKGVFRIPADPSNARLLIDGISKSLEQTLGAQRSASLLNSLDIIHYFGAFGALDAEIAFEGVGIGANDDEMSSQARYTLTSPTTGKFVAGGGLLADELELMFGKGVFKRKAGD